MPQPKSGDLGLQLPDRFAKTEDVHELLTATLATYAALIPICDPLGNAPLFLAITQGDSAAERNRMALKASIYMTLLLLFFFVGGNFILHFFALSMEAVRISGGLVLALLGLQLMNSKHEGNSSPEEKDEAIRKEDISFTPLAMPLLAGPGSIAAVMGMGSLYPPISLGAAGVGAGIILVSLTCFITLRYSAYLMKLIGVNGAAALTKIMGLLLLCIGVQLGLNGLGEWIAGNR